MVQIRNISGLIALCSGSKTPVVRQSSILQIAARLRVFITYFSLSDYIEAHKSAVNMKGYTDKLLVIPASKPKILCITQKAKTVINDCGVANLFRL
jgi:hypothetical protein